MAAGVGGWSADCIPAPGRQASVWRETKVVERHETLGFARVCVHFRRERRARLDDPKERGPGKGRGVGEWVARWFKTCPWQTMDCFGCEATGWLGAWSARHWANWQAGRQAIRQTVRHAGGWRVKFGIVPRRRSDVTLPTDQPCEQVPRPVCGLSPMQTCRNANRHTGRKADVHDCNSSPAITPAPRRSIPVAGILKKHEGLGTVLQLPAHAI